MVEERMIEKGRTLGDAVSCRDLLLHDSVSCGDWGTFANNDEFASTGSHETTKVDSGIG